MMSESNAKRNLIRNCTERGKKIIIDLVLTLKSTFENMKVNRFVSNLYKYLCIILLYLMI